MRTFCASLVVVGGLAIAAHAVDTVMWQQSQYADFEKGSLKKLALRSDGRLSLSPVFTEIMDSSSAYLWALVEDSKGNLYAGGGGPGGSGARLYVRSTDGKTKVAAELEGLEVHAVAVDRHDVPYVATSPDSKIYRIPPGGKPELFFDPHAKYIWAMSFSSKGDLFVATGDAGLIYRVSPEGKGSVFFRTEETHARSLALDPKDNLIVGTEPGGLILRITPSGEGFVLHQAPKGEITAVAVAKDGCIYAAGVGPRKAPPTPSAPPPVPVPVTPVPSPMPQGGTTVQVAPAPISIPPSLSPAPPSVAGSEVYRIDTDGFPRKVWSHSRDIAYAIGFDSAGHPLIGTGNKGMVYRLDSDVMYTALLTAPPTQVTAFCIGRGGEIYAATGNIGKVYQLGLGLEKQGSVESEVFDAGLYSLWGRLSFRGAGNGGAMRFETHSGNLDRPRKDWSQWAAVALNGDGGRTQSPKARFFQWKLTLEPSSDGRSPEVSSVDVAYLPRNVAPVMEQIEITPANYKFPAQSLTLTSSQTITLPPLGSSKKQSRPSASSSSSSVSMQYAKGEIGARWAATDENGDTLIYKVEIRGRNESEWKLLKDKVKDKHLGWDSTAFPDGEYLLRVTVSDEPSNPPDQALTAQMVSEPFFIDNTPPVISGLTASRAGGKITVRWKAKDALSVIDSADYSVNGGEWTDVEPVTKLSDARELDYELTLDGAKSGEKTVIVRVSDGCDNQSVASVVVK